MTVNPALAIPCLVVLVGPPGSGKTTWARNNGRGAVHVSQDGLIDAITPDGFEHVYRQVYGAAEEAVARTALEQGHTVIVDRTNRTRGHRERWVRIAGEFRHPAVAVEMTTAPEVCRYRNHARVPRSRLTEDRMERMLAAMERVRRDEGFVAVYSGDTVTLDDILCALRAPQEEGKIHEHCDKTR